MARHLLTSLLAAVPLLACAQRRDVKTITINLDMAPEDRFTPVFQDPVLNSTLWEAYNTVWLPHPKLQELAITISVKRGPENDEMTGEINGIVAASKLPFQFIKCMQFLEEILTIMVPFVNFTDVSPHTAKVFNFPEGYEALEEAALRFRAAGFSGFACTGIIARNTADGTVSHARNQDMSPTEFFTNLLYNAVFTRGGSEVFRAQMYAGYTQIITGLKLLPDRSDGFAIERNTRFVAEIGGFEEVIEQLVGGVELNGWTERKALEEDTTFAAAVERIALAQFASTEYVIISGVNAGTILSKSCQGLAHRMDLGPGLSDYIIMTNFDYYWGDFREFFDRTGGGGLNNGPSRRVAAQKVLDDAVAAGQPLTPDVLFAAINAPFVLADTIYQALMSAELGLWNTSIPVPYTPLV